MNEGATHMRKMISILFLLCAACGGGDVLDVGDASELDAEAHDGQAGDANDVDAADAGATCSSDSATPEAVCSVYCQVELVCGAVGPGACSARCMSDMSERSPATRAAVRACVLEAADVDPVDCAAIPGCLALEVATCPM